MRKRLAHYFFTLLLLTLSGVVCAQTAPRGKRGDRVRKDQAKPLVKAPAKSDGDLTLYGCVISTFGADIGINSFSATSSVPTFQLINDGVMANGGGVYANGKYYAIAFNDGGAVATDKYFYVYDADSWQMLSGPLPVSNAAADLTYDATTNQIYGVFMSDDYSTYNLGTLNPETGEVTLIGSPFVDRMVVLACNSSGDLYGIRRDDGNLYHINKNTAETTLIGNTGVEELDFWQSATFDPDGGGLYWFSFHSDFESSELYKLSLTGGGAGATLDAVDLIADFGINGSWTSEQVTGLFVKSDAAPAVTPGPVSGLEAVFENGSLTGKVKFTLPSTASDGSALSGYVSYKLTVGEMFTVNAAMAGSDVEEEVTVPEPGMYAITVNAVNENGAGEATTINKWIGFDAPKAVSNISLTAEGKTISLTWNAPAEGQHGGDMGSVTYTVVRQPDNVEVASGLTETSFTETIESDLKKEYWYDITPYAGETAGETASSEKVKMGTVLTVPYTESFDTEESVEGYTFIDANRDGSTWAYNPSNNSSTMVRQNLYYHYNAINAANDWAITPGLMMKKDNLYKISFMVKANLVETFSVAFGNAPTVEAMTTEVIPATDVTAYNFVEYSGTVRADADGVFYFGIHATSRPDQSDLYVDDLSITEVPGTAPAKVENLTVTPGEKGALSAELSFTLPTTRINGTLLDKSEIEGVNVYRDKKLIGTVTDLAPETLNYKDEDVNDGMHAYSVVAYGADGEGEENIASAYVGTDIPGAVRNLNVVEDFRTQAGKMVVTWDAPSEVGQNGGYVNTDDLVYYLFVGGGEDDVYLGKTLTYTDYLDVSKGQEIEAYCIYAANSVGSGRNVRQVASNIAGPALNLPVTESFPGITQKSGYWVPTVIVGETGQAYWDISDGSILASGTQDGDGGVMYFETTGLGFASRNRSPKIDIRGAQNPTLVFYAYLSGKTDRLDIDVSKEFEPWITVKSIPMNSDTRGWHRYEIPLKDYQDGTFLQVGFTGYSVESTSQIISVDNISIRDLAQDDLSLTAFTAPQKLSTGEEGVFSVTVKNLGTSAVTASDYEVELYKNDVKVASVAGKAIEPDLSANFTLTDVPTINDKEYSVYYAKVNYAADKNTDNNQSANKSVFITMPVYPSVTDLSGTSTGSGVALTWTEPNIADMPATPVTDNFESYKDFIITNIGSWKTVDGDGSKTIVPALMEGIPLQYDNVGKPMAFQVFNPITAGIPFGAWTAHSGDKMLVVMRNTTGEDGTIPANDDWLISPELNGKKQTVSFYAKSASTAALESFEVRYSDTDNNVESFLTTEGSGIITAEGVSEWNEYRFELPEGTKYFAIHCVSQGKLAFMVDDITYTPAGATTEDIMLLGYNVYRDGELKNAEPLGETSYTDSDVKNGQTYTYKVTTVYDKGESVYSNECTVLYVSTGIDNTQMSKVVIRTGKNSIRVSGEDSMDVKVYSMSGSLLYNASGESDCNVSVGSGIYLVSVNGKTTKVVVR